MPSFQGQKYQLFFSNKLPPLKALNYADELFFEEFTKLLGARYRILSIIRNGWQRKYGRVEDIERLKQHFEKLISNFPWADHTFDLYQKKSQELRDFLDKIKNKDYSQSTNSELISDLKTGRQKSAILDAMTNLFHLFSSLVGGEFYNQLKSYSDDHEKVNQNLIFYTQPIKESLHAKIKMSNLENKFTLSSTDANFSKLLRIGAFVNDDVSTLLHLRSELMQNLSLELSKKLNCNVGDLDYLQISEIEDYLLNHKDSANIIKERRNLTVLFYPQDKLTIHQGSDAESFLDQGSFKESDVQEISNILRGQTASLGKAKGKVVIAMNSVEASKKIFEGAILVAPYTAVEYVPFMEKAAAIITETGGITSHAAIVSREFNIPCVVGITNVTKILKDGQTVEVDADQGTIKILS